MSVRGEVEQIFEQIRSRCTAPGVLRGSARVWGSCGTPFRIRILWRKGKLEPMVGIEPTTYGLRNLDKRSGWSSR